MNREQESRLRELAELADEAPPAETNNVNVQAGVATATAGPPPAPAEEG